MTGLLMATKKGMTQVWDKAGRRIPVTELVATGNVVWNIVKPATEDSAAIVQIAYGDKKLKNMNKPLRTVAEKAGLALGKRLVRQTTWEADEVPAPGTELAIESMLEAGDVVRLSGTTIGKGFAGVIKRWGFHGGKQTHGQSDRERTPGSVGGQTPGRVFKGKKMPGHMGTDLQTLETAQVIAINPATQTIWIKGTVPGAFNGLVELRSTGKKVTIELQPESQQRLAPVTEAPQAEPETQEAA